jgi:hypothetical protein
VSFAAPQRFGGVAGPIASGRLLVADSWIASEHLGPHGFAVIDTHGAPYGLLGRDVLHRFRVRVVPGREVELAPRADVWQTADERVARWPWATGSGTGSGPGSACEHRACVAGEVRVAGDEAVVALTIDHPNPFAVRIIFGCEADGSEPISLADVISNGGSLRGTGFHHVVAVVAAGAAGHLDAPLRLGRALWLGRPDACRDLSVLDVAPLPEPASETIAQVWL